jgi:broad specificity phosphatase PhoE
MILRSAFLITASVVKGLPNNVRRSGLIHSPLTRRSMTSNGSVDSAEPSLSTIAATAKRLYLVRHGEVINPGGERAVFYGSMDVSLSKLGELEAQAAGEYLSHFKLSKVFSSPLSRAIYGAEAVLKHQKNFCDSQSIVILDGFKELDRGDWCGLTKEEIGSDLMARFDACDESVTPTNGESFLSLKRRVMNALKTALAHMEPGTSACVVSHLQVTRCILSDALGIPVNEMVNLKVATASVTCIDYEGASQTVLYQSFKPSVGLSASADGAN